MRFHSDLEAIYFTIGELDQASRIITEDQNADEANIRHQTITTLVELEAYVNTRMNVTFEDIVDAPNGATIRSTVNNDVFLKTQGVWVQLGVNNIDWKWENGEVTTGTMPLVVFSNVAVAQLDDMEYHLSTLVTP